MSENLEELSLSIYNDATFARQYEASILDNPWNAYYERPASLSLLPNLTGNKILDAGCGPGICSAFFANQGASVVAIDYSEQMVRLTKQRTPSIASTFVCNLNNKLDMFADEEFDVIYCSLVIHYVENWSNLFKEFARILKPGGVLVFSTDHPDSTAVKERTLVEVEWTGFQVRMKLFQRPWSDLLTELQQNNFHVEQQIVPVPTETCRLKYPQEYELLMQKPAFICVRARKL